MMVVVVHSNNSSSGVGLVRSSKSRRKSRRRRRSRKHRCPTEINPTGCWRTAPAANNTPSLLSMARLLCLLAFLACFACLACLLCLLALLALLACLGLLWLGSFCPAIRVRVALLCLLCFACLACLKEIYLCSVAEGAFDRATDASAESTWLRMTIMVRWVAFPLACSHCQQKCINNVDLPPHKAVDDPKAVRQRRPGAELRGIGSQG